LKYSLIEVLDCGFPSQVALTLAKPTVPGTNVIKCFSSTTTVGKISEAARPLMQTLFWVEPCLKILDETENSAFANNLVYFTLLSVAKKNVL
jgi:hypothetical protein